MSGSSKDVEFSRLDEAAGWEEYFLQGALERRDLSEAVSRFLDASTEGFRKKWHHAIWKILTEREGALSFDDFDALASTGDVHFLEKAFSMDEPSFESLGVLVAAAYEDRERNKEVYEFLNKRHMKALTERT